MIEREEGAKREKKNFTLFPSIWITRDYWFLVDGMMILCVFILLFLSLSFLIFIIIIICCYLLRLLLFVILFRFDYYDITIFIGTTNL